jgi:uncharacterized membrane protein
MSRLTSLWRWELLVVVLAESTLALALVGDTTTLRSAVIVAFLSLCPGLCLLRVMGFRFELAADIAYSVTASLIIVGIVGGITLYAGAWAPEHVANYLAATAIILAPMAAIRRNGRTRKLRRHTEP